MNGSESAKARLEEILGEVRTVDSQLPDLLTLNDSITELEATITLYESFENSEDS